MSGIMKRVVETSLPARNKSRLKKNPLTIETVKKRYTRYQVAGTSIVFHFTASVVFVEYDDRIYACSHDHLLCYAGKVDTHVSYRILLRWAGRTYLSPRDVERLSDIIELLHVTHIQHDQEYFPCAKLVDGLCQAYFLMHADVDGPMNDLMLRQVTAECLDNPKLDEFRKSLAETLCTLSASALIEASCFGKISGHPSVDVDAGLAQLYSRTTSDRRADSNLVRLSVHALKEKYVIGYIQRHKRWPPLLPGSSSNILALANSDALPDGAEAARLNVRLTHEDWDTVDFAPTRALQGVTSLLPFIKDRTISLNRNDLFSSFAHDALKVTYTEVDQLTSREAYERSALVLYVLLTRNLIDEFREFLDLVIRSSMDDYADVMTYLIIKIVPKEGEIKSKARLFGEKPFSYRLYSMVQEETAVEFLQEYYTQDQAMTCGELELKQWLHMLTTMDPISPEHTYVHLVIDVSGWNNGFRQATVGPLGKVLDQICGLKMFERTQKLYEHSVIVNKTTTRLRGWDGQAGGIEGLNQDTWVIVYLSQMHALFKQRQYKYHFMDMGDNFIAKIAVPNSEIAAAGDATKFAMNLSKEISVELKLLGHDAKPDETTCSLNSFIFCHQYRVGGVQLPGHFRKATKTSGINDSFLPFLDDYIACAFSNAHSTAEQGCLSYAPYHIATVWAFSYLLQCQWPVSHGNKCNHYWDLSDDELVALLMTPSVLGGFPIIYLETMYIRSEADHLPQFHRLRVHALTAKPAVGRLMTAIGFQEPDNSASLRTLLSDPRALALTKPQSPRSIITKELDGRLARIARNEEIMALFECYDATAQEALLLSVQHNKTWPARVLAAMYGASGFAVREALVACFECSRTAIAFLLNTKPFAMTTPVVCRRVLQADQGVHRWRVALVRGNFTRQAFFKTRCPYIAADKTRSHHWKREVTTITTPPMGHLFTLQQETVLSRNSSYIGIRCGTVKQRVGTISDHLIMSQNTPFLGHMTSSATRNQPRLLRSKDALIDGVLNLAVVRSWADLVDEDGSVGLLVDRLIAAYTDITSERLQVLSGVRSHGSIEHHLRSRGFNPTIAPNSTTNLLSLFATDTRTCGAFMQGKKYAVNFLEEMLFAQYQILQELQWQRTFKSFDTNYQLVLTPCECFVELEVKQITVAKLASLHCLQHSVLTVDTRRNITQQLTAILEDAGERGSISPIALEEHGSLVGVGLMIAYWGTLVETIDVVSIQEMSDTHSWIELAYLRGVAIPKTISLNIVRQIQPEVVARLLRLLNQMALLFDARRAGQITPNTPSTHSAYAVATNHLCTLLTEGALHGPIMHHLLEERQPIIAGPTPLYQAVWYSYPEPGDHEILIDLLLPADIEEHAFTRVLEVMYTEHVTHSVATGVRDADIRRRELGTFVTQGKVSLTVGTLGKCVGYAECESHKIHTLHRCSVTRMNDLSRKGRNHYGCIAPQVPQCDHQGFINLRRFEQSIRLDASLRSTGEREYDPAVVPAPSESLEIWHSTTHSPSRLLATLTVLGAAVRDNMTIAVLGDGRGGISNMFADSTRHLTIHYSTKFLGVHEEQGPDPFPETRSVVDTTYMTLGLRDVTRPIWRSAFANDRRLIPDVIICDAELESYECHLLTIDSLGPVLSDNPGHGTKM